MEDRMKDAVVIFSGGPDSTAAALWAVSNGYSPELLTFLFKNRQQYGELKAAISVAGILDFKHTLLDFKSPMELFEPNAHILMHAGVESSLVDKTEDHRLPFGAAMILTTAANYAMYVGASTIVWGATLSDSQSGNFEYTQEFCSELSALLTKVVRQKIEIVAPFAAMRKYEVVRKYFTGREELFSQTWSCKSGLQKQSGNCHASRARRIAAKLAGIKDLTIYQNELFDWVFTEAEFNDPSSIDFTLKEPEGSEPWKTK
jgi:7-cyano-7-deazaguanine synthase